MRLNKTIALFGFLTSDARAHPTSSVKVRALEGQATFYGGNTAGGLCSFSTFTIPSGVFGTALSDSNWGNAASCGACVSVRGPNGNRITAVITDQCPGCGSNHLDLYSDAFAQLADLSTGVIDVSWDFVRCPISTPLELRNKEGVSAYWFSMQVVNANEGVRALEVSTDRGSTWTQTQRQNYNFFEIQSGTGTNTVDVRVTSRSGSVVVVSGVQISPGSTTRAKTNF